MIKYLKLIVEPDINTYHITFCYFGKNFRDVDPIVIQEKISLFFDKFIIKDFTLNFDKEDMYGQNNDIPVYVFNTDQKYIDLRKQFMDYMSDTESGKIMVAQNQDVWSPHISLNTTKEPIPTKLKVTGIKSDDNKFLYLFD
jgi:hypothetical protein